MLVSETAVFKWHFTVCFFISETEDLHSTAFHNAPWPSQEFESWI